ncbi:MHYT domain-containing protein [Actinacidiphila glaucinigra]|uniref:MHYT domain-containing protein n=1 Tax=Actinacidiphila glaucinigra TaxID=235986 RepID=UPI0035DEC84E
MSEGWPWLISGALTLGSGIWGMHFIAMLGFTIDGVELRYDVPLSIVSLMVAVVIVGLGILVAHILRSLLGVLISGVGTGLGVAAMHYMGMAALLFPGELGYDTWLVTVSLVIAISAATTALWFTLRVRGFWTTLSAALVMAVAISGMHYTGMTAVSVRSVAGVVSEDGVSGLSLVAPLIIGLGIEVMMVTFAVLMNPIKETSQSGKTLLERSFEGHKRASAPVSEVLSSETYHVFGPEGRSHRGSVGARGDHHTERRSF